MKRGLRRIAASTGYTRRRAVRKTSRRGSGRGRSALSTGPETRASCEINVFSPGIAGSGRAGSSVPPSVYQLPVRKVPGWGAFRFPPGF